MKFYTDLTWMKKVEGGNEKLMNIFGILELKGAGKKPITILVQGNLEYSYGSTIKNILK